MRLRSRLDILGTTLNDVRFVSVFDLSGTCVCMLLANSPLSPSLILSNATTCAGIVKKNDQTRLYEITGDIVYWLSDEVIYNAGNRKRLD